MDRVKLGRALGYGTRHAARTMAAVVEAAATPDPGGRTPPDQPAAAADTRRPRQTAVRPPVRVENVRAGAQHLKRSFWQPLAVFSGALWLRVTGLFFALIALTMGGGAWRLHDAVGPAWMRSHRIWAYLVFGLLFGYFAVSSFVRASLKERRAAARR